MKKQMQKTPTYVNIWQEKKQCLQISPAGLICKEIQSRLEESQTKGNCETFDNELMGKNPLKMPHH